MGLTEQLVFLFGRSQGEAAQLSTHLEHNNFLVRQFFDLESLAEASINEHPFALIFTANALSSRQDLEKLKHGSHPHSDMLPLIIIVGDDSSIETCITATHKGGDFFFRAPLNAHQLIQHLRQQEDLLKAPSPRVLIIDDEFRRLENYRSVLSQSVVDVQCVTTLSSLTNALDQFQPDLLLIDCQLTPISPKAISQAIKQSFSWQHIAIIVLTDHLDVEQQNAAITCGVDALLLKPVDSSHLLFVVKQKTRQARAYAYAKRYLDYSLRELEFQNSALNEHAISSATDMSGRITSINKKFCEISGYNESELLGHNHRILKSGHHSKAFYKNMWDSISNGEIWHGKICNKKKNGKLYWVESTIVPFLDAHGRPYKYVSIRTDITDLRLNESRLNRSQIHANIGTWDWDIQTGELFWSNRIGPLFGYGQEVPETTYENFIKRVHPDDKNLVERAISACIHEGKKYNIEHRVLWPDGTVCWMHEIGDVERSEDGKPLRMLGLVRDITEKKEIELALQKEKQRLLEAQRIGKFGDWTLTKNSNNVTWSPQALEIFGFAAGEKLSLEKTFERVHPEDVESLHKAVEIAYARGYSATDFRLLLPDNTVRWVHGERYRITDNEGNSIGLRGTLQDISERKQVEQALAAAKEDAEKANQAKSEFLSSMSHELRTPLNAIMGFGQLLQMNPAQNLNYQELDNVDEILKAGGHLLTLINEILDLAKIESGHITLSIEAVNINELMGECLNLMTPIAQQSELIIEWDKAHIEENSDPFIPWNGSVLADRTRLKQALLNLLSNAIKYNHAKGKVSVSYAINPEKILGINITDTGPGMSPEQQSHLFESYNRLGAEKFDIQGAGIGLVITKNIIELMGGSLTVQSQMGKGSTFQIQMPIDQSLAADTTVFSNQRLANSRQESEKASTFPIQRPQFTVLHIEDNPANLRLVEQILSQHKHIKVINAPGPALGLELATAHQPDLIMLDINLPGMNGYEVLKNLHHHNETCNIPVIAVSANAMPKDVKKGQDAGFYRYITKPVDVKELLITIKGLIDS